MERAAFHTQGSGVRRSRAAVFLGCLAFLTLGSSCARKNDTKDEQPSKGKGFTPQWDDAVTVEAPKATGITAFSGDCSLAQNEDIFKILNECGIANISEKTKPTLQLTIPYTYTRVINAGVARAIVPLTGVLNLYSDLLQSTLDVGVEVRPGIQDQTSTDGCTFHTVGTETQAIKNRADFLTKAFRGAVVNKLEVVGANFDPKWRGIQCTVLGAVSLVNTRGGFRTEVEFDAPYVPNISPIASKTRYEKELGDFKIFRNLGAKVVKTNNPVLQVGKVYRGNIVIEKVPAIREVLLDPNSQRLDDSCESPPKPGTYTALQGDTAYRVTNHFGTDEETLALGFHLWTEYYIDHTQRNFSAVVANVGDDDLMYFVGKYTGGKAPSASVSFARDIQPLVAGSCGGSGCHLGGGRTSLPSSSYEAIQGEPRMASRIEDGSMPPGGLSAAQKALFRAWYSSGMPPN